LVGYDLINSRLENYLDNIEKCNKLIKFINSQEINDFTIFDIFCYWYDHIYEGKRDDIEEEEESLYITQAVY
jgi:hypothetical protein